MWLYLRVLYCTALLSTVLIYILLYYTAFKTKCFPNEVNNPRKYRGSNRGSYSRHKLDFQTWGTFCLGGEGTGDSLMNVTSHEVRLISHSWIVHEHEYEFWWIWIHELFMNPWILVNCLFFGSAEEPRKFRGSSAEEFSGRNSFPVVNVRAKFRRPYI